MASFSAFLKGEKDTKKKPASTGSFSSFLKSQAQALDPKVSLKEQAKANVLADPNNHVFNPLVSSSKELNTQLDQKTPSAGPVKNFFSAIPNALKTVGKLATELPVNFAKSTYNAFVKPSSAELQTEKQLRLDKGDPVSQFVGKLTARAVSTVTEPYAKLLGSAVGDRQIADKVSKGELPPEVLGKTNLSADDYVEALTSSANLGLVLAPFVSKFASKGALKLSELTETKSKIELTHSEISDITRGRSDLVDPVKVEAFKTAIKENLGAELKATGKFTITESKPNSFSNFLKNSATRPISEINTKAETPVPKRNLLTDGSEVKAPVEPQDAPREAIPQKSINITSKLNEQNLKAVSKAPTQVPETLRVYHTTGAPDASLKAGTYVDSNLGEHIARGTAAETKLVADIPKKQISQYLEETRPGIYQVKQTIPDEFIAYNSKAHKELTYKPIEEPQIKTPEIKTSKLAQGVEEKAISKKLTDGFGDLPEYAKVNVKDQAKASTELLKTDRNKAINIAMGHELPPEGILPESVFVAVENHAIKTKDVALLRELATSSSLTSEATGMGQRIRMLAERDPNSAVSAIRKVQKAKEDAVSKKYSDVKKVKEKIKDNIKAEIRKAAPKAKDWNSFLSELKCT